jgi:tetratricopeptide (TPR) repeat protein
MPATSFWKSHCFAVLLIFTAGLIAYGNSFQGAFHFDDLHSIVKNDKIRTINPLEVYKHNNHFRFLGHYSFALNYSTAGYETLWQWHAVNIFLHLVCAILFYFVLVLLLNSKEGDDSENNFLIPIMAALLFAVHPLSSEPVNYIQARHVLFYSIFCLTGLLSAIALMRAKNTKLKLLAGVGIIASLILGGLSKELGLFCVPLCIGLGFLCFRKKQGGAKEVLWLSGIALLLGGILLGIGLNYFPQQMEKITKPVAYLETGEVKFYEHLFTQAEVFWQFFIFLFSFSSQLNITHQVEIARFKTTGSGIVSVIAASSLIIIFILAVIRMRKTKLFSFLVFWAIIGYFPYFLIRYSAEMMVEYKIYLSALAFFGIIALLINQGVNFLSRKWDKQKAQKVGLIFFAVLVLFSITQTWQRNEVWSTEITLWEDAVSKAPNRPKPYQSLGDAYRLAGETDKGIKSMEKALLLGGDKRFIGNNLGAMYTQKKKYKFAVKSYQMCLKADPNCWEARYNLANVYTKMKLYKSAISEYREASKIKPINPLAYKSEADTWVTLKNSGETIKAYEEAIKRGHESSNAFFNLGNAYKRLGKTKDAIKAYKKAVSLAPKHAKAFNNLGISFTKLNKFKEAIEAYKKAIEAKPEMAIAHLNLMVAYINTKNFKMAIVHCDRAKQLGKKTPKSILNLLKKHRE